MPGFTALPPEPDVIVSHRPALQFSLRFLALGHFAKYCKQYVRVLHYVLLPYSLQSENLLAFALCVAFPRSLGGRYSTDYYASSVAWPDFQALPP